MNRQSMPSKQKKKKTGLITFSSILGVIYSDVLYSFLSFSLPAHRLSFLFPFLYLPTRFLLLLLLLVSPSLSLSHPLTHYHYFLVFLNYLFTFFCFVFCFSFFFVSLCLILYFLYLTFCRDFLPLSPAKYSFVLQVYWAPVLSYRFIERLCCLTGLLNAWPLSTHTHTPSPTPPAHFNLRPPQTCLLNGNQSFHLNVKPDFAFKGKMFFTEAKILSGWSAVSCWNA